MARLDAALGGPWWREIIKKSEVTDAASQIVHGFVDRFSKATNMHVYATPVRRAPHHKPEGIVPLFDMPNPLHPDIKQVEAEARPVIAENIATLANRYGRFTVGDHPDEVFGDYIGRVRETVVRAAIKDLHAAGRTPSDGKGKSIAGLTVIRQQCPLSGGVPM